MMNIIRSSFRKGLPTHEEKARHTYSVHDCLLSAFAMFHLKYPSLLQFDHACQDTDKLNNIRSLYGVENIPCDTTMRERLDPLSLEPIHTAIHDMIGMLQRSQSLQNWNFLGTKLVSLDGTGFFSSTSVHCSSCCEKHHRNGTVTYHHQMLVGSIVHPDQKQVFPLLFEPISKEDGAVKNDCERNAAKRWLRHYRQLYPNMPTTVVEDGLSSNAPHIRALQEARCHYILGAKPDDHPFLFDWFNKAEAPDAVEFVTTNGSLKQRYRFMNHVPLNDANYDLTVNVLCLEEEDIGLLTSKGKPKKNTAPKRQWVWVTDYELTPENVQLIASGGRARWKIENETFQTLKTQGYHFEHNYGHGYKNLSHVLAGLMILAFLMDQVLLAFNTEMKHALSKMHGRYSYLWQKIRSLFDEWVVDRLETLYLSVFQPPPKSVLKAHPKV
jgi:hypothetical protein